MEQAPILTQTGYQKPRHVLRYMQTEISSPACCCRGKLSSVDFRRNRGHNKSYTTNPNTAVEN
jgi:hypothetical protein